MNILARVHLFPPHHCAGAEMMLVEMLKALVTAGHRVQVHLSRFCPARAPYELAGVEVYPRDTADWQDEASKADVLITHLDNTSTMVSAALAYDRPLVQVLHNTHPPTRMWASCKNDLLVYNSEWMRQELGDDPKGIVVHPPVFAKDYEVDASDGYAVTLVNLYEPKGGLKFAQMAALMPDVQFLGVKGAYGEQLDPHLPNVEVREHGTDMLQVYRDTRLVVMPSYYESYGRVAIEAMSSGIPVIASRTPGLLEAMGLAAKVTLPVSANAHEWTDAVRYLLDNTDVYDRASELARSWAHDLDPTTELATFVARVEALPR